MNAATTTEFPPPDLRAGPDRTSAELKRGMFFNTIALMASNFRGVFTFLVARLLGAAALGTFLVAWATTDTLSKVGIFGLDNAIIPFIARAEGAGERARSRALFHLAVFLTLVQSALVAGIALLIVRLAGKKFGLDPQMAAVLSVLLCAMPGVNLYRTCTAVSRAMKVMKHDIWSRGMTEPIVTTATFLVALTLGWRTFGAAVAAIVGTGASGIVAFALASSLFRSMHPPLATALRSRVPVTPQGSEAAPGISYGAEAKRLLAYAASISGYDLINSLIVRLDVIMLGCFIGRAPGVTLGAVGIYGAVVEVASGLRKVNQAFTPIFAPLIAGMTTHGEQEQAAAAFARVAQWMLWILLPLLTVIALAGPVILSIYGPAFREGAMWLNIVALACGTNCFVGLAETVIMVQRPHLNLINSSVTCGIALAANFWLIKNYGVTGAAFGILLPYVVLGILRHRTLRLVFGWRRPWHNVAPPIVATLAALVPAAVCRVLLGGLVGEFVAAAVFLGIFGAGWWYHFRWRRD
ncbi:MAG: oligosaccharide flippase family protein [Chthoniobacterales bacterium]